MLKQGY